MSELTLGISDERQRILRRQPIQVQSHKRAARRSPAARLVALQNQLRDQAVQRLHAQRSGDQPFDLDDDTVRLAISARM